MKPARITLAVAVAIAACATPLSRHAPEQFAAAHDSITADDLQRQVRVLASDRFEGRAPGTAGERRTVEYLTARFRDLGLQPGNPDGSFVQSVPLVGITAERTAELTAGGQRMRLNPQHDYVALSRRFVPEVRVSDTDVVFVGYGVVAPEYGWNDYKDVDVTGKTIVMLVNDPAVPDPSAPGGLDPDYFNGKAMTYYGRWTYKYEIASEKGAAAALIVHETGPAGYPYEVVSGSWGRENFDIDRPDGNRARVPVEGWITEERARTLLRLSGQDFDALKQAAARPDFRPVALPAKASFTVRNTLRKVSSQNVVARLEGSDPALKDQHVVYTAHWDHLGRDRKKAGDQIFNGAVDNATGTAALLELAEAFRKLDPAPRRSLLFLAVTAEEKGLLGSKWYAEHPLYPLATTAANINMDGLNPWGRTRDVVIVGNGQSTLEDVLADAVAAQQRVTVPDPESEKGFYYRSDHFEFAKVGVPALYVDAGIEYVGRPPEYGRQKRDEYTQRDYHKVSDELKPDWDLSGAVEEVQLLFRVGLQVAEESDLPEWKSGSEFKARREEMLGR